MERDKLSRLEDLSNELDGLYGLLRMAAWASVEKNAGCTIFESAFRTISDICFDICTELEEIIEDEYK